MEAQAKHKKHVSIRFEPELIEKLRDLAAAQNRNFTNTVETILLDHIKELEKESNNK